MSQAAQWLPARVLTFPTLVHHATSARSRDTPRRALVALGRRIRDGGGRFTSRSGASPSWSARSASRLNGKRTTGALFSVGHDQVLVRAAEKRSALVLGALAERFGERLPGVENRGDASIPCVELGCRVGSAGERDTPFDQGGTTGDEIVMVHESLEREVGELPELVLDAGAFLLALTGDGDRGRLDRAAVRHRDQLPLRQRDDERHVSRAALEEDDDARHRAGSARPPRRARRVSRS